VTERLLVSKREAAAMLGLSIRTLENLIALKELPARHIGRRCLIERQVLERFARRDHLTQPGANASGAETIGD
jgi:excisionase family DNA binding protein